MKTVTVTTQNAINYGAVLQAYALQQVLFDMGIDDSLLDLRRGCADYYRKISARMFLSDVYNNLVLWHRRNDIRRKEEKFAAFIKENIHTTHEYIGMDDVLANPPEADAYITGGDQMFNRSVLNRPTNILDFGRSETLRISYSTSLGTIWFQTDEEKSFFAQALSRYSAISLREKEHVQDVHRLINKNVSVNIDPTLLLETKHWEKFISNKKENGYILCYSLLNNPRLNELVMAEKERLKKPVWVISPDVRCYVRGADKVIFDAGPKDFIELLYNADEVISTSFHGVCFSIIFRKPFYCLTRQGGDPRFRSLLETLNLENRNIDKVESRSLEKINYLNIEKTIATARQNGKDYLRKALESI